MGALFKGKDLERRLLTAGLRRRTHPGGIAADNNQSFFGHVSDSSMEKRSLNFEFRTPNSELKTSTPPEQKRQWSPDSREIVANRRVEGQPGNPIARR
jgi:hypothetical protein